MTVKSFALYKNDPVVKQFKAGLRAWEHPYGDPDTGADVGAPEPAVKAKAVRVRGTIKVRGSVGSGETDASRDAAFSEDDPVVEQFRDGVALWERPFERRREDD